MKAVSICACVFFCLIFMPFKVMAYKPDQIPLADEIEFKIFRNGNPFGIHRIRFSEENERLVTDVIIRMSVGIGPFSFFKYEHENREVWKDDTLISMDAYTDDDGKEYNVTAKKTEEGYAVTVNGESFNVDGPLAGTTYWNIDTFGNYALLNTQKGYIEDFELVGSGVDTIEVAGKEYEADHYIVKLPEREIHAWYEKETKQWVGLRFSIRGSNISYYRETPIERVQTPNG